jgi:hypothetical protein
MKRRPRPDMGWMDGRYSETGVSEFRIALSTKIKEL